MRRFVVAAVAASLLGALLTSPITADTGPADSSAEFDRFRGSFDFSQGGRDFRGQVLVQQDTPTGASIASFFFYSAGPEVTCDNGTPDDPSDDFTAQSLIDFTANEAPTATLSIDSRLASADASAIARGQLITLEACTDAQTSTPTTVAWHVTLSATRPAVRSTTVGRFPNDDGTVTMQWIKIADRPADGSITIETMTLGVRDGSISHTVISELTH